MAICHTHNMLDELSSFLNETQLEEVKHPILGCLDGDW